MNRIINVDMPKNAYISWFVTTQNALPTKVVLKDDNGKEYFSAKKQNYLNTSIDPPLALGATFFTGSKLTLTIDVDTKYELKGKPTLIDITDDNGNVVGKSFDLAVEDYTDNDYNDIYVTLVGWTHKG